MSEVVLAFDQLTIGYPHSKSPKILFEHISPVLKAGELVCFMGPNGIGKSTLLKTMAGLMPALSKQQPVLDPQKIAIVLTDRVHAMHLTVRSLIAYGRYPYVNWKADLSSKDNEAIDHALTLMHLEALADKEINNLSDGQLQMVMIARALVQDTPVILLDEPTAHLDLNNRLEVTNILRKLAREKNKAILVSTHELDLALQTADILWLADDKKLLTGIPEDLVLDGSLDRIFQFKGFDLKTGKVFHEVYRKQKIKLLGEGHIYLWTKNALERCGYEVGLEGDIELKAFDHTWEIENTQVSKLQDLLKKLN